MSNNIRIDKQGFLESLYDKLFTNKNVLKVSDGVHIVVPEERIFEFLHDLGVLVEESFKENATLDS